MTFYWWSHWFWITSFTSILLITIVHTYPSQEISLEHNRNQSNEGAKTGVTKLYQTSSTATLEWSTVAPNSTDGIKLENTVLQSIPSEDVVKEITKETHTLNTGVLILEADSDLDDLEDQDASAQMFLAMGTNVEAERKDESTNNESLEFKRSAENYNKTNEITTISITSKPKNENTKSEVEVASVAEIQSPETVVESGKRKRLEISNYTNFSSVIGANAQESSAGGNGQEIELTKTNATADMAGSVSAPAGLRVYNAHSALEWINTVAPKASSSSSSNSSNSANKSASNEESIDNDSVAQQSQRVPFTLENANKEDELRRAESEHRSRKSKVLSAEYKHINRFINLSSDSKNLLTRSASSAPEYDAEEGNISSEALAIQRTYFLDAGAISAICFSIFGVCCAVGTVGIVLYRRRYLNKPQALSEPDSSVYIDDSTMRVSDNSDEMYSLDNDSFLNSLEAMTIQNYWTDTVKHTKL